ncbi:MAG TPA: signal recognition particle protein [Candidatus Cloacimonadota bacterium]|jgi:signal recognition particle subunit SRP54|nr:signal recognition particle protein [Candidatus Cloacimonadales bacterium]HPY97017.1 signal recognition particle protein [Candidatus Cloacimonadota bacterium]HQB41585.1 signal recognition particle protein [Candidatus Cloacimonadota bacterium]
MFADLSDRLNGIFKTLRGRGKLSESNIEDALKEIRMALLEADVNFRIVKNFIKEIQARALGQEVMKSLEPGQQVVKIVHEQLISLMGNEEFKLDFHNNKLTKIMLVGLQGSGKTTACAKLANYFRKKRSAIPSLVACDVYRPAAIHQLEVLGKQLNVPVISDTTTKDVKKIAKSALEWAQKNSTSLMIFDTAGRLHIDQDMMKEVRELKDYIKPDYIFFVADAMTGQDAVNVAKEFNDLLAFDAVILTKLDGDARGGAALSIKAVTDKPIAFVGVGEKISDLEEFYPDRMASRILGMGDVLSLIEKAQEAFDESEAEKLAKKMKKNQFTFTDFLEQLNSMKKLGPLDQLLKMIPGINQKMMEQVNFDGKQLAHIEAIIQSMTIAEREKPQLINGSRRIRIANGSGTSVQAVNRLLKQFDQMKSMMKNMNASKLMKNFKMPF